MVIVAAVIGLVAGGIVTFVFTYFASSMEGERLGAQFITNILLGGILGVLLFQAWPAWLSWPRWSGFRLLWPQ
jgi:hypothetical protein